MKDVLRRIADIVGLLLCFVVPAKVLTRPKLFRRWERKGVHILPVRYEFPIPDTGKLDPAIFVRESAMPGVDLRPAAQLAMLEDFAARFADDYARFPMEQRADGHEYFVRNRMFQSVDAEILYGMIRDLRPRRIIEVGSGFSTLLMVQAIADATRDDPHYTCELTTIDPVGGVRLRGNLPSSARQIPKRVQDVPLDEFARLERDDILFLDSSHIAETGSDVTYEILEILPRLQTGAVVHVHDVFFPNDYPEAWVMRLRRFWNEQFVVHAFLAFNRSFEVLWASHLMYQKHPERLAAAFPSYPEGLKDPGSLWLRKVS